MLNIALDNGCLNVNRRNEELNALEDFHKQGLITLKTSTVLEKEQNETNDDPEYRAKYLSKIDELERIFEIAIVDKSVTDRCVVSDGHICNMTQKILLNKSTNSPNDFYDWWILTTAIAHECDFFITINTKDFIDNGRKEQIEKLGIQVRYPDENLISEIVSHEKFKADSFKGQISDYFMH